MNHVIIKCNVAVICCIIILTSCSSEAIENVNTAKNQMTITATYATNAKSRTSLGSDLSVLWAQDDALSVFDNSNNNAFYITSGIGTTSAEFSGTATAAAKYYAVYPYQTDAIINGNVISNVEIPSQQIAAINSFDPKANVMTAISTLSNDFEFKNICSYAKITTTTACRKIVLTAGDSDNIAGKFDMTFNVEGVISVTATDGTNEVTLNPANGETFAAGTYYIAINACTLSGLTVQCVTDNYRLKRSTNATVSLFNRGVIVDFGEASVEEGWKLLSCCDGNHPHYFDLGLPSGVKWSCMNMGAESPEDFGCYYAWGEVTGAKYDNGDIIPAIMDSYPEEWPVDKRNTYYVAGTPKTEFGWQDYKWGYLNWESMFASKTVLTPDDDTATANWHGKWRMPSSDEMTELINNCYWVWTSDYKGTGLSGCIAYMSKSESDKGKYSSDYAPVSVYNLTDNHIFLPAQGIRYFSNFHDLNEQGNYWSCTIGSESVFYGTFMGFDNDELLMLEGTRYAGLNVRAVWKDQ